MTVILAILGVVFACVLVVAKALLTDEVRGRIQRRVTADVEATIASLPQHLQDEWAEEWRADLATLISMPIVAARFARGLRQTAAQLVGEPVPAPAGSLGRMAGQRTRREIKYAVLAFELTERRFEVARQVVLLAVTLALVAFATCSSNGLTAAVSAHGRRRER